MSEFSSPPSHPSQAAPSSDAALRELVARCLDRMEVEGPAALDALCREHPEHAAGLRARVLQLGAFGLVGPAEPDAVPERLGAFRLQVRLGGGGMGVVYAAEQEGLGRQVALKLLRPGTQYFGGARERFRREVAALARLQHPGIVPVHAGGEENGVPYLAMELVRGATWEEALAEVAALCARGAGELARLHGRDLLAAVTVVVARRAGTTGPPAPSASTRVPPAPPPPLYAGNWVVTCTRVARAVADALRHAHEQGVLHRDVKPSNVMLAPDGRVLLLDFGLAAAAGSARLTGSGQALGSPAYMAPEQVRGEVVDGRADVWGLGVTLYEALTLTQPFAAASLEQTARLVLAAHPPSPRALNPVVPRDLETVVLAALERDPARRHRGPAELCRDLDNVLELRPITARPPGLGLRLLRFTQRRPALAVAAALGGLLLVAGPLGWDLKRRQSLQLVLAARDQAERHFRAALASIGYVLREVATDELADVPRAQRAQLAAIERALDLFVQLERDRPDDEVVLAEGSALRLTRGHLLRDLGRPDEALPEFEQAVLLRRRLLAGALAAGDAGAAADLRFQLAAAVMAAAKTRHSLGQPDAAVPLYEEAGRLLRQVAAARPDDPDVAIDLAIVAADESESRRQLGQFAAARVALDHALAQLDQLPARPDDPWIPSRRGRLCGEMYLLLAAEERHEEALSWARRALAAHEHASAVDPGRRYHVYDVAGAWQLVAECLFHLGDDQAGEAAARTGTGLLDGLLADYPDVARYHALRHDLHTMLGVAVSRHGRHDEALALFGALVTELEEACRREPDRFDLAFEQAQALQNVVATRLAASGDPGAELETTLALVTRAEQQIARAERLVARARQVPAGAATDEALVMRLRYSRALALCLADRLGEADPTVVAFEAAAGDDPVHLRYAADLWNEMILAMRRVRAAGGAATPPGAGAAAEAAARARMFALLGRALDAGYADGAELRSTPALDSFRDDPAFTALLIRLPAPE